MQYTHNKYMHTFIYIVHMYIHVKKSPSSVCEILMLFYDICPTPPAPYTASLFVV